MKKQVGKMYVKNKSGFIPDFILCKKFHFLTLKSGEQAYDLRIQYFESLQPGVCFAKNIPEFSRHIFSHGNRV